MVPSGTFINFMQELKVLVRHFGFSAQDIMLMSTFDLKVLLAMLKQDIEKEEKEARQK